MNDKLKQIILSKLEAVADDCCDYALNDSEDREDLASELASELLQAEVRRWQALPFAPHGVKWTAVLGYTRCTCEAPPCQVEPYYLSNSQD